MEDRKKPVTGSTRDGNTGEIKRPDATWKQTSEQRKSARPAGTTGRNPVKAKEQEVKKTARPSGEARPGVASRLSGKQGATQRKSARPDAGTPAPASRKGSRLAAAAGVFRKEAPEKVQSPERIEGEEKGGRVRKASTAGNRPKGLLGKLMEDPERRRKVYLSLAGGASVALVCLIALFAGDISGVAGTRSASSAASSQTEAEAGTETKKKKKKSKKASEEGESDQGTVVEREPVTLTVSVVGDCTLGTDENFDWDSSLNNYYDNYGPDYFLENVKSYFEADDLTIANMEGTLTYSDEREDKTFAFKGDPEFAQILTNAGVDCANLANNHSHDYGDQGYQDTIAAMDQYGLPHFGYDDLLVLDVKGVKVGITGIYVLADGLGREQQLRDNIQSLKDQGSELIIAIFHWGEELEEAPNEEQTTLGRLAIDLGADLVCGHHPHVLQGIEVYKGKNIVYSLGNFCFGGNTYPTEFDTAIFQQTFTVTSEGVAEDNVTNIVPCWVSSVDWVNDYRPTPQEDWAAEEIHDLIAYRSSLI